MSLLNWLHLPVFLLLVYLLWQSVRQNRVVFWVALGVKLAAGVALGFIFFHQQPIGDAWSNHRLTLQVLSEAGQDPAYLSDFLFFSKSPHLVLYYHNLSNSFFFIKLQSLLYLLTGNSYWWSGAYLSLFSFWGCWFLVERLRRYFPAYGSAAVVAFLFFPSVVFWTSGATKDALFMGSLCLTIGVFLQFSHSEGNKSWKSMVLLGIAGWLLWKIKFFLAAVLLVLLVTFLGVKLLARQGTWLQGKGRQFGVWVGLVVIGAFFVSFAHPTFTLSFFARHIVWNYQNILQDSAPDQPLLLLPDLQPTMSSVLVHAPEALLQMLFRPFVWEPAPLFYRLAGLENLVLLLLVFLTVVHLVRHRKVPKSPGFLGVLLLFCLIGGVLVALPTPNFGSLHRYRAPLLPFFYLVVLAWGPIPHWLNRLLKARE